MLKNKYGSLSQPTGTVDLQDMTPGNVVVQIESFTERSGNGTDIIELGCKVVYAGASDNPNNDFIGKTLTNSLFFGQNAAITIRQLKDLFRERKADVPNWKEGGTLPLEQALPGAIKLLAWKGAYVSAKIDRRKNREQNEQNFFTLVKILDTDPETGEPLPEEHIIPKPLPNDLIVEALGAEVKGSTVTDAKSVI